MAPDKVLFTYLPSRDVDVSFKNKNSADLNLDILTGILLSCEIH